MGTRDCQPEYSGKRHVQCGQQHLAGDHVDRVAVLAPSFGRFAVGQRVIGLLAQSSLAQASRHGFEPTPAQGLETLCESAEGRQALHPRYAVESGESDVPQGRLAFRVLVQGVGEYDESCHDDDGGENRASDDHGDDADDRDDDLADRDDVVPVVREPVADVLPPRPVLNAGVGRLIDLVLGLPRSVLTHLPRVLGHLLRRVQRALCGVDRRLGVGLRGLGVLDVTGGGPDLRLVRPVRVRLAARRIVLVLVRLLRRPRHPRVRRGQLRLSRGEVLAGLPRLHQRPVRQRLRTLQLRPEVRERVAAHPVRLLQLPQVLRHTRELVLEDRRRLPRPLRERRLPRHPLHQTQRLGHVVGEVVQRLRERPHPLRITRRRVLVQVQDMPVTRPVAHHPRYPRQLTRRTSNHPYAHVNLQGTAVRRKTASAVSSATRGSRSRPCLRRECLTDCRGLVTHALAPRRDHCGSVQKRESRAGAGWTGRREKSMWASASGSPVGGSRWSPRP